MNRMLFDHVFIDWLNWVAEELSKCLSISMNFELQLRLSRIRRHQVASYYTWVGKRNLNCSSSKDKRSTSSSLIYGSNQFHSVFGSPAYLRNTI
ncbi:hypothetical protein NC652_010836 [Populus alba x Populus x berolinensis]|nr:hypothetical protein NC652_010836 [Populus alba x Populus x berolinensis]